MSAVVALYEFNGQSGIPTKGITKLNYLSADQANGDPDDYPVTIPTSGTAYSYEKWFKIVVTDIDDATTLSNFKVWYEVSDTYSGPDVLNSTLDIVQGTYSPPTVFAQPVNTASSLATKAVPSTEPGSANVGVGGLLAGTITATGGSTDYIVLQLAVDEDSVTPFSGNLKYSWDES